MTNEGRSLSRILVAGATGYLGKHVVAEGKRRGYFVRALVRPGKAVAAADEVVEAQATEMGALAGLCDGVDAVFSSLGITRQTDKVTYMDVDYGANHNVLREAVRAGVKRFGFVSVVRPELFKGNPMLVARERFVAELQSAEIESTVVRATGFFSDLEEIFNMARRGRVYLFDDGCHRSNPIHGSDLAGACLDAMERGLSEVTAGGPDILTQMEIAHQAFEALNRSTRVTTIPSWLVGLFLACVRPFSSRLHTVGSFMRQAMTHDMIGEVCGSHHLADHYRELADGERELSG
jgi:uncharacterized protein YbjT (DUF2867 family)